MTLLLLSLLAASAGRCPARLCDGARGRNLRRQRSGIRIAPPGKMGGMMVESRNCHVAARAALFCVSLGVLLPLTASGQQWNYCPNPNDICNTNPGNVGIGTTTPAYKLDVGSGIINNQGGMFRQAGTTAPALDNASWIYTEAGVGLVLETGGIMRLGSQSAGVFAEWMRLQGGKVGIGTTSPATALHVVGDATVMGNIAAKYQDVAEWVPARRRLTAGTVVVVDADRSNEVTAASVAYTRVAGVVSKKPGLSLGEAGDGKLLVAAMGRVRVRVDATRGPIRAGDLLVTSDREGYAMRSEPLDVAGAKIHRPGTLIGKALEPLAFGTGEILVLLSLQ